MSQTVFPVGAHHLDIDCGIAFSRISAWLDDELGLANDGSCWTFHSDGNECLITLERLEPRSFANIDIERTRLIVDGAPETLAVFEKLFTLRFISAGG